MTDYKLIEEQSRKAVAELIEAAGLKAGKIMVVGCSTSEVAGQKIGSGGNQEIAAAIMAGIYPLLNKNGIFLAAQCCEHLNRALIIEEKAAGSCRLEQVNVVPQPCAGGAFSTAAYKAFDNPVAVEYIKADAGIDIGGTLIGMHLKAVAVPVRISVDKIGQAAVICARTRPKFIGGSRAAYDQHMV
ncbi:MAG: TIGR01440 family protein [Oscillospiraceae bacterium]|nr:TIGR01440 family protein [Oscillospiraceae bacterium]